MLPPSSGAPLADPYLEWALRTNFRYIGGTPKWIPLLLELDGITSGQFARLDWADSDEDGEPWARVPDIYNETSSGLEKSHFCTVWVKPALFAQPNADVLTQFMKSGVKQYEFGLPLVPVTPSEGSPIGTLFGIGGPQPTMAALNASAVPTKVVIGIIDDGIAFAHERFQAPAATGGTRIEYLWIQDVGTGGLELKKSDIDPTMTTCTHGGLVDETEVYRVLGLENYVGVEHKVVGRHRAHGTHVMDIAAGFDPASAPNDRPIVAVQLPGRIVRDTGGAHLTPYVAHAIRYILDRADAIAALYGTGPLPVVINLSYGLFAGPHDGTRRLEKAIEHLVHLRKLAAPHAPFCVVLPAGNNYLWRTHAHFDLRVQETRGLQWRVVPDGRMPSFLEIWLRTGSGADPQVDITITSPTGRASAPIKVGVSPPYEWPSSVPGTPVLHVAYETAATTGTHQRVTVILLPTAPLDPFDASEPVAPSGLWKIELFNAGPAATIDVWIQRNDTPFGWPIRGRQSYFDEPGYHRFDTYGREIETDDPANYTKREGTINSLATGTSTVVIGGCRRSDLKPAKYSAAGPIVPRVAGFPPPRTGPDPDAMAISDDSVACQGVLAAGTRSNSVFAMNGTSVAAPQVTRWIAKRMLAHLPACRHGVHALASAEEAPRPHHAPADREGAGRVDDLLPPARVVRWRRW